MAACAQSCLHAVFSPRLIWFRTCAPRRSPAPRSRSRSRSRGRGGGGGGGGGGGRLKGEACKWNPRGFGFIKPLEGGGDDVFCHVSVLTDGNCLREGDTVEYEVVYDDRKGKYRADKVTGARTEREEFRGGGGGGCESPVARNLSALGAPRCTSWGCNPCCAAQ
jgi:cold shock CspA family protein